LTASFEAQVPFPVRAQGLLDQLEVERPPVVAAVADVPVDGAEATVRRPDIEQVLQHPVRDPLMFGCGSVRYLLGDEPGQVLQHLVRAGPCVEVHRNRDQVDRMQGQLRHLVDAVVPRLDRRLSPIKIMQRGRGRQRLDPLGEPGHGRRITDQPRERLTLVLTHRRAVDGAADLPRADHHERDGSRPLRQPEFLLTTPRLVLPGLTGSLKSPEPGTLSPRQSLPMMVRTGGLATLRTTTATRFAQARTGVDIPGGQHQRGAGDGQAPRLFGSRFTAMKIWLPASIGR
jgi:hypothetical protein